jgi:hypothetical protein
MVWFLNAWGKDSAALITASGELLPFKRAGRLLRDHNEPFAIDKPVLPAVTLMPATAERSQT